MIPLPEIDRCECGCRAGVFGEPGHYYIACKRERGCWFGPSRRTIRGAILAWNKIMVVFAKTNHLSSGGRSSPAGI